MVFSSSKIAVGEKERVHFRFVFIGDWNAFYRDKIKRYPICFNIFEMLPVSIALSWTFTEIDEMHILHNRLFNWLRKFSATNMGVDAPLFIFALLDEGYLLFLIVYFVSFIFVRY